MALLPVDVDILPPSDDRVFKTLLTHPDAKKVLVDVVSTVIDRTVVDAQVRNIEMPAMDTGEKAERFDVNCTVDSGDQVDVEMHCSDREETGEKRTNFINKYIYYLTDLHSSQKSKGIKYKDLVRTYQVTFCTNTVFPYRAGFVSRFSLRTTDGEQLSDQINMVIVELDKLDKTLQKPVEMLTAFEKWSLFFRFAPEPMHRRLINDIIRGKEEIGMASSNAPRRGVDEKNVQDVAHNKILRDEKQRDSFSWSSAPGALLQEISRDERERAILRSRRMAETDRISDLLTAEERGEIRGEAIGMAKGQAKVITLLKQGLSLEEIERTLAAEQT